LVFFGGAADASLTVARPRTVVAIVAGDDRSADRRATTAAAVRLAEFRTADIVRDL